MGICFGCLCGRRKRAQAKSVRGGREHGVTTSASRDTSPQQCIASRASTAPVDIPTCPSPPSVASDNPDDFQSCRDNFSVDSGTRPFSDSAVGSSLSSPEQPTCTYLSSSESLTSSAGSLKRVHGHPQGRSSAQNQPQFSALLEDGSEDDGESSAAGDSSDSVAHERRHGAPGCLAMIEAFSGRLHPQQPSTSARQSECGPAPPPKQRRRSTAGKPDAGVSLSRRDMSMSASDVVACYDEGDGMHYNIRSVDYMKTKLKVNSTSSIYRLAAADTFSFDKKQDHIARLVNLPAAPSAVHRIPGAGDACFPPLLIVNIQIPSYAPSIFGKSDGPGWSAVFYFTLPEDFDPAAFPNQKALGLFERFVVDGKEADGSATRDRFKLIPRVVNVDEFAQKGPLSAAEHTLLSNYNEKPILSRPQHRYYRGPNYLEIDLDIHAYAYLAKTFFASFLTRLAPVIWENAFVIQGNGIEELPEQVLACGRMYRTDFTTPKPFASFLPKGA